MLTVMTRLFCYYFSLIQTLVKVMKFMLKLLQEVQRKTITEKLFLSLVSYLLGFVTILRIHILLQGGGDCGVLREVLKHAPKFVTMVEVRAIYRIAGYFRRSNISLVNFRLDLIFNTHSPFENKIQAKIYCPTSRTQ